jgi:hypothetical protein
MLFDFLYGMCKAFLGMIWIIAMCVCIFGPILLTVFVSAGFILLYFITIPLAEGLRSMSDWI